MAHAETLDLVNEFTVVLPQRYRSRVVGVLPHQERAILLLIQDFTRVSALRARGDEWNHLEPVWRLFRYDAPDPMAIEVCTFTQSVNETLHPVLMARDGLRVFLLFHNQVLEVLLAERRVETVCKLRLPGGEPRVRGFAVHDSVACLCVEHGDESEDSDLALHWVPFDDRPTIGSRFPGSCGNQLAFGPNGDVYVLDLLDVYCYSNGKLIAEIDLSNQFAGWHAALQELMAVGNDGQVYVGCGNKLIILDSGLSRKMGEHALPDSVESLAFISNTDRLLLSTIDGVNGTLIIREVRC